MTTATIDPKKVTHAASALHIPRDLARALLTLDGDRRVDALRAVLQIARRA